MLQQAGPGSRTEEELMGTLLPSPCVCLMYAPSMYILDHGSLVLVLAPVANLSDNLIGLCYSPHSSVDD